MTELDAFKMPGKEVKRDDATDLRATLWRCDHCNSLVSVYSAEIAGEAWCPFCITVPLEFCGNVNTLLGLQFPDA